MGSRKGRGNQNIRLVKVLHYKLLTNNKQLPAFQREVRSGFRTEIPEVKGQYVTTAPP